MLMSNIHYQLENSILTITYPQSSPLPASYAPKSITHPQLLSPAFQPPSANAIRAQFNVQNMKSLRQKMDHFQAQNVQFGTNQILHILVQIYAVAHFLHRNNTCLGPLTANQIFYQNDKIFIAAITDLELQKRSKLIFAGNSQISTKNDFLSLKYVTYQLLTLRTPPIPFLCDFSVPRARFSASGIYNFFRKILTSDGDFCAFADCNVRKISRELQIDCEWEHYDDFEIGDFGVENQIYSEFSKTLKTNPEALAAILLL
ncbi:hypothetical protein SS50377_20415 [Spironucleus salmonicida]|uniref:Protein kinase domain-containing protein n=1 Tax=Spironucleus salmonicida TaxID=348837 RepID=V6LPD6_9EUKA|nr:hypothetical protein SS50377_20415 [Spironucleus salmonicida]|eukprot:EST45576.1 Hypothetical protein SS50377_14417 [Spironucleus salmonicida]